MTFAGRIALVTGAGSGIGEATARGLAARGATVILAGRTSAPLEALAGSIRADGGTAHPRPTDVTDRHDLEALIADIEAGHGRLDLAVNNAGGHNDFKPLHETPPEESDWVFDLNLKAVYNGMRAQIALMLKTGGGAIVNTSSIFGLKGVAGIAHYVAAKHGVIGLTKAAALDYARSNIRINAVCPGATETPNLLRVTGGDRHALDPMIPVGHLGQPGDIASLILWLLSDEASYITGASFSADGGMSAG
ncbi:SDR family NAD(P)-dependent oxidoreductase [Polymorphobacter sp.]|uniref:SDR family NAD(P)-dependent oxidoreductase n=1 Tax=Polymorphobacter sp. TaxID=1909290 RepID=UPI003F722D61